MVLIITGVLAVAVVPRFFNTEDYQDRGFYDETVAALRYAQKSAIAQRRTVCVAFTSTTVTLHIATSSAPATCAPGGGAGTVNLDAPNGDSPFVVTAKGNAGFSSVPANFKFNALGQPLDLSDVSLPVAGKTIAIARFGNVRVEAETGYVY